jgi:uncharacterized protein (TIGR02217 family)
MAVDNVVMDERMALGFKGGPVFSTDKLTMVSGQERRLQNRSVAIHTYQWSYKNTSLQIEAALKAFWFDRRGDFKVWLLKDWSDYSGTLEPIGLGTGALTTFQIIKTYSVAATNPYQRTIRHLKPATLAVYVDGVLKTITTHYTVNATGLVTFVSAPTGGQVVTATYEFYVPVRFEGDVFTSIVDYNPGMDIISVEDLRAIEVIP